MSVTDASAPTRFEPGEPDLAFFGRVVAGQCHELTNVSNVANELCGLQQDLLSGAGVPQPDALARVADLASRIQAQLQRGQAIVRHVHRLAHSVGAAGQPFDAREVVERAAFMAEREARLRETALEVTVPDAAVTLDGAPFRLQQAIHLGIELLLQGSAPGRRVIVALTASPESARVTLERADPVPSDDAAAGRLVLEFPRQPARGEVTDAA